MPRLHALAAVVISGMFASTSLADWTETAFPVKKHDFGTVAVAAKTEFAFPVVNNFDSVMHIQNVRRSCGCTTPIVENAYIEPGQTGEILARFNTDTFKGKRGATLTVVIDQPFYAEARLRVDGYIRSDVVFHPGAVDFGQIEQGESATSKTTVYYAGRDDWEILDVKSNRPWLKPTVKEVSRGGGRVTYEILVNVREDASGFFQDELTVVTNDRSMPRVPLRVTGTVDSTLTISPKAIALGSLKPGESVRQKLVVLGRQPFTIASITADGWDIQYQESSEPKKTHVLMTEFTPTGETTGPQKTNIQIEAEGEESISVKALLTADVRVQ